MEKGDLKDLENITFALEGCQLEDVKEIGTEISETCDPTLAAKFPKPRNRIPAVFLHKPVKFPPHMRKILNLGISFYRPIVGRQYTKICCKTFDDYNALIQYLQNRQLPYHTYGLPQKIKMKVVFRGLPKDFDLELLKKDLTSVSIPVVRAHIMQNTDRAMHMPVLVLVVVPNNDEGRKILQVQKLHGYEITIEPLKRKTRQCFRCQKWGHSQRYCYGHAKCVKCGGDHFTKKCTKDRYLEPPKCANCASEHTSNFKLCPYSPDSPHYVNKTAMAANNKAMFPCVRTVPRKLITLQNCHHFLKSRV